MPLNAHSKFLSAAQLVSFPQQYCPPSRPCVSLLIQTHRCYSTVMFCRSGIQGSKLDNTWLIRRGLLLCRGHDAREAEEQENVNGEQNEGE